MLGIEEVLDLFEKYAEKDYVHLFCYNSDVFFMRRGGDKEHINDPVLMNKCIYCFPFLSYYGFYNCGNVSTFYPQDGYVPTDRAKICYDKYMEIPNIGTMVKIEKYEEIVRNKCNEGSSVVITYDFYSQFSRHFNWRACVKILGYEISDDLRTFGEMITHQPYYRITKNS